MSKVVISPRQLDYLIDNGRAVVIDIRDDADYQRKHIRSAVNMPEQMVIGYLETISNDKYIVICCERGARSLSLVYRINQGSYRLLSLAGGVHNYYGKYLVTDR